MLYKYNAKVVSAYDGDTIRAVFDLGFGIQWHGERAKGVSLRLSGIDTPELRGEERADGIHVRDIVRVLVLDRDVVIKTEKDESGKYGRYLANVLITESLIETYQKELDSLLNITEEEVFKSDVLTEFINHSIEYKNKFGHQSEFSLNYFLVDKGYAKEYFV
jgi:micrococcal nuclease